MAVVAGSGIMTGVPSSGQASWWLVGGRVIRGS